MDLRYCKNLINSMEENIYSLQMLSAMSINSYQKNFYNSLLQKEMYKLNVLKNFVYNMEEFEVIYKNYNYTRQQSFTIEELSKYDGKNGNKAYVAVDGVVYDVTYNAAWAAGTHFGLKAGNDLSNEISSCHNKEEIVKKLDKIGILIK